LVYVETGNIVPVPAAAARLDVSAIDKQHLTFRLWIYPTNWFVEADEFVFLDHRRWWCYYDWFWGRVDKGHIVAALALIAGKPVRVHTFPKIAEQRPVVSTSLLLLPRPCL